MNIPLNIDWQQILLHALNLVLLIAGLYLLLYKPVKKFMAQREARYQGMADAAEEKTRQAQQMYDDYAGKLRALTTRSAPSAPRRWKRPPRRRARCSTMPARRRIS